jgi:4-hydroxy-4-methyl-2-oxoglutarate aldolase
MNKSQSAQVFRNLEAFDSCSIANAVDTFKVRLSNEGFTGSGIACRTEILTPMVGVALTMKVRSADPSMKPAYYLEQPDWWERIEDAPSPRVLLIEDTDAKPGRGSLVGPVHACIIKALGFVGVVTTGAIRGTRKFTEIGLHAFSANVSPSHAFSHVVEIGGPIMIAGMQIRPGEIIHGDRDGIVSIPADLADRVPDVARRVMERERKVCDYCNSSGFSRSNLRDKISADTSRW